MMVALEDVIKILEELQHDKTRLALTPDANVYRQYANLGIVEGVSLAIKKLTVHFERELYT